MTFDRSLGTVAIVPFYSQADNINIDSCYAYLRIVVPVMAKMSPKTLFLFFFPDPKYGRGKWGYTPDGFQSENVKFVKYPYDTAMRTGVLGFDPVRFSEIDINYGVNIYWMNQVEMLAEVSGGYRQSANAMSRPSLFAQHHYIIHDSLPYPTDYLIARRLRQMSGTIAADKVIYNSQHAERMAKESFQEYLNEHTLLSIDEKSQVLRFGLIDTMPPLREYHKPVIVYNHRFEAYKRPQLTAQVLNSLKNEGYDFEVWTTQAATQRTSEFPLDKNVFGATRSQYLENIAVPAINTINTTHETFCISILDSMALGHLVVVPDDITFPELLPPDYPYRFKSETEQKFMMRDILDNWESRRNEWSDVLRAYALERFNTQDYARKYLEIMYDVENAKIEGTNPKETTKAAFNRIFDKLSPNVFYNAKDVCSTIKKISGLGDQASPTARVIREASIRGFSIRAKGQKAGIIMET